MCDRSGSFGFSNPSINSRQVFENEAEEEGDEGDCICGPESCKTAVIGSDELSLDSVEDAEVVTVSLWENIVRKSEEKLAPYRKWIEEKKAAEPVGPAPDGAAEFLNTEIFPLLLPAMRLMLVRARDWDALHIQKCRFNGLDFLAEVLWNRNPRYPNRSRNWQDVFSIPPFRLSLKLHPRPIFPKSWLWSREEGALVIQKWVRGWLVRKKADVQEMRLFWKAIISETELEAAEMGITYSQLMEKRRKDKLSPCQRYRNKSG